MVSPRALREFSSQPAAGWAVKLVDEKFDLTDKAFPYLAVKEITIAGGVTARLFRLSFSGEMAYELAVPARYSDAAIRAVMGAGEEFGITPYGTEALGTMRIEDHGHPPEETSA